MRGTLRPDAHCPVCGLPLDALVDETSGAGVVRKYFHGKDPKRRRPNPCVRGFAGADIPKASAERRGLEVGIELKPVLSGIDPNPLHLRIQ